MTLLCFFLAATRPQKTNSKLPVLRSFLKDGEAECYEGVTVKYVGGRQATLIVYEDDNEKDRVVLQSLNTKEEMHQAVLGAGFVLKSEEERQQILAKAQQEQSQARLARHNSAEYVRKRDLYVEEFRDRVVQMSPLDGDDSIRFGRRRRPSNKDDVLQQNYDRINNNSPKNNSHRATSKEELLESARNYLLEEQQQYY